MPLPVPVTCVYFHTTLAELSRVTETVWPGELRILMILPFTGKGCHFCSQVLRPGKGLPSEVAAGER